MKRVDCKSAESVWSEERERTICGVSGVVGRTPTSLPSESLWFIWVYGCIWHAFYVPAFCAPYTEFLGDVDSKAHKLITEQAFYGDLEVPKLECVGHVQKRLESRL